MISKPFDSLSRIFDKAGTLGTLTAAMGCASCFPALGSLASSLGMSFLAQYEGIFINTLLPFFAAVVLVMNAISFTSHRIWYRGLAGITGPILVLLTLYPLWAYAWSTYLLYTGITFMLLVSLWDIFSPPHKISLFYLTTSPEDYNEFINT
ncbi:MAG: organomercurial transporter MerC [Gammaproteobacteria bacterium]|nr:organomercurial transporter MerC [Gammaproteobacteria bacterium]